MSDTAISLEEIERQIYGYVDPAGCMPGSYKGAMISLAYKIYQLDAKIGAAAIVRFREVHEKMLADQKQFFESWNDTIEDGFCNVWSAWCGRCALLRLQSIGSNKYIRRMHVL